MRHINESIIGRKGSYTSSKTPGREYQARDLEYGDIVKVTSKYYIYLPVTLWWGSISQRISSQSGIPVRYNSNNTYYRASYLTVYLSRYKYEFVGYAKEYKDIKTPEDLKAVFDKYNIPYE